MKICIVIPFYEGDAYIQRCVHSIQMSQNLPLDIQVQIYIVDNNRVPSKQLSFLREVRNLKILKTKPRIGFARAANFGAYQAIQEGGQLMIILNQDTFFKKGSLKKLIDSYSEYGPGFLFTPLLYDLQFDGIEPSTDGMTPHFRALIAKDYSKGELSPIYQIDKIAGACLVVPAEVMKKTGLFDPFFFMYGEDTDFIIRAAKANIPLLLITNAKVAHRKGSDRSLRSNLQSYRRIRRAKLINKLRHQSLSDAFVFWITSYWKYKKAFFIYLMQDLHLLVNVKGIFPAVEAIKKEIDYWIQKDRLGP